MKFRTDFVTNSSSSAFIFERGTDYNKIFKKNELRGMEKRIEKISEMKPDVLSQLFYWFGMSELMDRKEKAEGSLYAFLVLAYGTACDVTMEQFPMLRGNESLDYDKIKSAIISEELPQIQDGMYSNQKREMEITELLQTFIQERKSELLFYVDELEKNEITLGMLSEQFFECEDLIHTEYDLPCEILDELWKLEENIRHGIYHM